VRRSGSAIAALAAIALLGGVVAGAAPAAAPKPPRGPSGAALRALAQPPTRAPIASQRFYFVMPDRYANGDPSNDRAGLAGDRSVHGYDPTQTGWYHGGDLRGLTGGCTDPERGLARIRDLGFSAVWVTPPIRQKWVQDTSAAYHGYWGLDFTTVDPHLGTDADFATFVDCAHSLGLKVYLDVVVNHTADVVRLSNYTYASPEERPWVDCSGARFNPAAFVRAATFPCLSPERMPRTPSVPPEERDAKRPAWLNDVTNYHNRGDIDFGSCSEVCFEQGDFFGLDDLFTEKPVVSGGLADLWADWIRRYRLDGFRVDTARHVNRAFFPIWLPRILAAAREANVPDFQVFGEAFITNAADLSDFVRQRGLPTVLDFPMQDALARFAGGSAGPRGISARLADDDLFQGADGVAHTPPTFIGNHDIGRAANRIREQALGVSPDQLLGRVQLGHSLLYLLRGAPVVMYGDEFGIIGRGGDQQARQDLFPTQVAEWQSEARVGSPPIGTGSAFDSTGHPMAEHLRALGALRGAHPALSIGSTTVRRAQGSTLVVSRIDAAARREYVAAFNAGTATARFTVATSTPSSPWVPLLGGGAQRTSNAAGSLALELPPLAAVLLRAEGQVPARPAGRPVVRAASGSLAQLALLRATAARAASVAFAVKRGRGAWARVGVDDSPPYRAFVQPSRFRRGERVWAVAVARGYNGRTVTSRPVSFVPRR
jgi:glycosidase